MIYTSVWVIKFVNIERGKGIGGLDDNDLFVYTNEPIKNIRNNAKLMQARIK